MERNYEFKPDEEESKAIWSSNWGIEKWHNESGSKIERKVKGIFHNKIASKLTRKNSCQSYQNGRLVVRKKYKGMG